MTTATPAATPYQKFEEVFNTRKVANCAWHVIPYLKPDSKILDFGCGPGSITNDLAQRCPEGNVVGLDINHESIAMAESAASASKIVNVVYRHGVVEDLRNLEADSFDIVHAHQVMLHLPDPVTALQELRRVVKPGGILAIRDLANVIEVGSTPHMEKYRAISGKMIPQTLEAGQKSHIWMHQAGFQWDRIRSGSAAWEFSGAEGRKMWSASAKGSARKRGLEMGLADEAFFDAVEKDFEAWADNPEGRMMALDSWVIGTK